MQLDQKNFMFALNIEDEDYTKEVFFNIDLIQHTLIRNSNKKNSFNDSIKLTPCTKEHF